MKEIQNVSNLIKEAYSEVSLLSSGVSIKEECDFSHSQEVPSFEKIEQRGVESSSDNWDCFLSHSWRDGAHEKVVEIAHLLKEKGVKVWLDAEEMEGDSNKNMQDGILKSQVFVGFVTEEYLKASNNPKNNAGKEFNFAANTCLEKIILVVLEPELLDPSTWNESQVRFHLPGALYVDMSSPTKIVNNIDILVDRIKTRIERLQKE